MIPQQKAAEIYQNMFYKIPEMRPIKNRDKTAIDCAIVAVELLIIQGFESYYWQQVKKELKLLY